MEANEGRVNITQTPYITIADKPLGECSTAVIAREIMTLCKKIAEQRDTIRQLRAEKVKEAENAAD